MGYVGVTQLTMEERWSQHARVANAGNGKSGSFQGAIRMYGEEAFDHYLLQKNVPSSEIENAERAWILEKATLSPFGFNLCEGGKGSIGYKLTDEERAKNSARVKSLWSTSEYKEKIIQKQKEAQNRPEVKAKLSALRKDYQSRPEVRAENSARTKSLWSTSEHKEKIIQKQKEAQNRPEVKAAKSAFQKDYQNRPERRAAASARVKSLWSTSEYKEKTVTRLKEAQNRPEVKAANSARSRAAGPRKGKYKGVFFHKSYDKWKAAVKVNNKSIKLGTFPTEEQAARAYDAAARLHFGKGCYLNFPTDQEREEWAALIASLTERKRSK
jgi:hypothetical protein